MVYLYLALSIFFEVFGSNTLHYSKQFTRIMPSILTVFCYIGSYYFFSQVLRYMQLGITYAITAGSEIFLTTLCGFLFFKQKPDLPAVLGMFLIITGVVVINVFSKKII